MYSHIPDNTTTIPTNAFTFYNRINRTHKTTHAKHTLRYFNFYSFKAIISRMNWQPIHKTPNPLFAFTTHGLKISRRSAYGLL